LGSLFVFACVGQGLVVITSCWRCRCHHDRSFEALTCVSVALAVRALSWLQGPNARAGHHARLCGGMRRRSDHGERCCRYRPTPHVRRRRCAASGCLHLSAPQDSPPLCVWWSDLYNKSGMMPGVFDSQPTELMLGMCSTLAGTLFCLAVSTSLGLPISTAHAIGKTPTWASAVVYTGLLKRRCCACGVCVQSAASLALRSWGRA
jgi:hypothetical protein